VWDGVNGRERSPKNLQKKKRLGHGKKKGPDKEKPRILAEGVAGTKAERRKEMKLQLRATPKEKKDTNSPQQKKQKRGKNLEIKKGAKTGGTRTPNKRVKKGRDPHKQSNATTRAGKPTKKTKKALGGEPGTQRSPRPLIELG